MPRNQWWNICCASLVLLLVGAPVFAGVSGDANCTQKLNDISAVIAVIFGAPDSCPTADVNGDGAVTVADVTGVELAMHAGGPTVTPTHTGPTSTVTSTPPPPTPTRPTFTATTASTPTVTATATTPATSTPTLSPTPAAKGPQITYFGLADQSGNILTPISPPPGVTPVYAPCFNYRFFIVVEAAPGPSGAMPGTKTYNAATPDVPPDLQIRANHNLGNGSPAVCDAGLVGPGPTPTASPGGVPGIGSPPPDAATVGNILNDFGCRFETHAVSADACTLSPTQGIPSFIGSSTLQFCTLFPIGMELQFPDGDTLLTVQVRDVVGNLGLPANIIVRIPGMCP